MIIHISVYISPQRQTYTAVFRLEERVGQTVLSGTSHGGWGEGGGGGGAPPGSATRAHPNKAPTHLPPPSTTLSPGHSLTHSSTQKPAHLPTLLPTFP